MGTTPVGTWTLVFRQDDLRAFRRGSLVHEGQRPGLLMRPIESRRHGR